METAGTRDGGLCELDRLTAHLARARAIFLMAFPDETDTFDRIESQARMGRAFIEIASDGKSFLVLQPVRDLHVWTVGGSMAGVLELEESVSKRAAESGFDRMTALPSRKNWDHALRERGWKTEPVAPLVKDL